MGILSEQNILGDPALADAIRPGPADGSAAAYSFATDYVTSGPIKAITPWFVNPSTYGIDPNTMKVTKTKPPKDTGIDGETLLYDGTRYGNPGFNPLPDAHSTRMTAVAEVLAGNSTPEEDITGVTNLTSLDSFFNHETDSSGGAVASGGESSGYDAQHEYEMTMGNNVSQQITNPGGHGMNSQTSISVDGPSDDYRKMMEDASKPSLNKRRSYYSDGSAGQPVGDGIKEPTPFLGTGIVNVINGTPGVNNKVTGGPGDLFDAKFGKMFEDTSTNLAKPRGGPGDL